MPKKMRPYRRDVMEINSPSSKGLEVHSIECPDVEPVLKRCRNAGKMMHDEKFDADKWRKEKETKTLLTTRNFPDIYSGKAGITLSV